MSILFVTFFERFHTMFLVQIDEILLGIPLTSFVVLVEFKDCRLRNIVGSRQRGLDRSIRTVFFLALCKNVYDSYSSEKYFDSIETS